MAVGVLVTAPGLAEGARPTPAAVAAAPAAVALPADPAPPPTLRWRACADARGFQCATIRVPLDYDNPQGRHIRLAVTRLRASGDRIGSVFFNPGGPGGPGVSSLQHFSGFFPAAVRKRFDLVSWDPRGIGQSTAVQCFDTPAAEERFRAGAPVVPVGHAQEQRVIAVNRGLAQRCDRRNHALLRHMSTADTARDLDLLRAAVGDARLRYWGVSYGTFLGATYANLFPGRVGAVVLDANVRPEAWVRAPRGVPMQPTFLRQHSQDGADATLRQFLRRCGHAGVSVCPFAAAGADATVAKFDTLVAEMRRHPTRLRGGTTYSELLDQVANGLYFTGVWPQLATRLQQIWTDTPVTAMRALAWQRYDGPGQQFGVICGESPNPTTARLLRIADRAEDRYGPLGPFWIWAASGCTDWLARAADPYSGPWNKATSAPVLVIGNTYDPGTPLSNARVMARSLSRSRLLIMRGYGHTALMNPSGCINTHVARYLTRGVLPADGTRCDQDDPPFAS